MLIVDDTAANRVALRAMLAPLGRTVLEAASGHAALRAVLRQDFAVILMDVRMPILDGYETAKLIRQRVRSQLTPFIFVTAFGIDRSFVTDLSSVPDDAVIARSTIDLAHNLGLTVVAEGVEEEGVLDILTQYGCDSAQGYYFRRPCPAPELTDWLTRSPFGAPADVAR